MNGLAPDVSPSATQRSFDGGPRPRLDNWLAAPGNKWAFRHARELFWSERVRASARAPLGETTADGLVDASLADYLARSHTDALVVLSDGEIATEWYAEGVRQDDRHMLFSCTKSVVGLVASVLLADGRLDEKALVTTYVPEAAAGGYADATVRDLLDMAVDIEWDEDYEGQQVRAFRVASGQLESVETPGIHRFTVGLKAAGEPGRRTRYVSPSSDLAGWICERATGQSLAELISDCVWEPMGAEWEGDLLVDRFGASRASGGLCAAARDMARIGHLLLRDDLAGPLADAVASVKEPGDAHAWAAGSLAGFLPGAAYRSFWYQVPTDPEVYLAAGIHGQRIYVDVPRRVVIAQQASLPGSFDEPTWVETLSILPRIARAVAADR